MTKKMAKINILLLLVVVTLFMGIGYAAIDNVSLEINGVATAENGTLFISEVVYKTNNNANPSDSSINQFYDTILNSHVSLGNDPNSTITYTVTITNATNRPYYYDETIYDDAFYNNENITFELNGIEKFDIVASGESITFDITFKYANNNTTNNELSSVLNFKFSQTYIVTRTFYSIGLNGTKTQIREPFTQEQAIDEPLIIGSDSLISNIDASEVKYYLDGTEVAKDSSHFLTKHVTLEEDYLINIYEVSFDLDGGSPEVPSRYLLSGSELGELPATPIKETCAYSGTGTPDERLCSYMAYFEGWFLDPTFETPATATSIITSNTTVYAKWTGVYYHYRLANEVYFDGIDDYIDTGVNIYNKENINRDFDISFDLVSQDYDYNSSGAQLQPSIMNAKDESSPWYSGFVVRLNTGKATPVYINNRWGNSSSGPTIDASNIPLHFEFKRRNGIVTARVTYGTNGVMEKTLYNQSSWTIDQYAPYNIVFGSSYNAQGNPFRFFRGTLANLDVEVFAP